MGKTISKLNHANVKMEIVLNKNLPKELRLINNVSNDLPLINNVPNKLPLINNGPNELPLINNGPNELILINNGPKELPLINNVPNELQLINNGSNELPLINNDPNEFPLINNGPNELPLTKNDPNELPVINNVPNELPLINNGPNELPLINNVPNKLPLINNDPNEFPLTNNVLNEFPLTNNGPNELPLINNGPNELPLKNNVPDEIPLNNNVSAYDSIPDITKFMSEFEDAEDANPLSPLENLSLDYQPYFDLIGLGETLIANDIDHSEVMMLSHNYSVSEVPVLFDLDSEKDLKCVNTITNHDKPKTEFSEKDCNNNNDVISISSSEDVGHNLPLEETFKEFNSKHESKNLEIAQSYKGVPTTFDFDDLIGNSIIKKQKSYENVIIDNDDAISISSTSTEDHCPLAVLSKKLGNNIENSSDGYHSSDFEFITEEEANLDGLIINFDPDSVKYNKDQIRTTKTDKVFVQTAKGVLHISNDFTDFYSAGPSTLSTFSNSRLNSGHEIEKSEEVHTIPQGEDFEKLFQGNFAPILARSSYLVLENKSTMPITCMNVEFEGLGFDLKQHVIDDSDDDNYRNEADECMQKILTMYPEENRGFKRRKRC